MSDPLKIPLVNLKEEVERAVKAAAPAADFPDALTEGALVGPVTVEGLLCAVDEDARFEGSAKGRWTFECSRCLKPVESAWSAPLEAETPLASGTLDLVDEVRQAIALAQPMKTFCKTDCKGLCPVCRADRNAKDCGHKEEAPDPTKRHPRLTIRPKKR